MVCKEGMGNSGTLIPLTLRTVPSSLSEGPSPVVLKGNFWKYRFATNFL